MSQSATHSYYDWQVSTLLLAYDAVDPIARQDADALTKRQQAVELELHDLAHAVLPRSYLDNPQADFPPEVVIEMTRATLRRAAAIIGLLPAGGVMGRCAVCGQENSIEVLFCARCTSPVAVVALHELSADDHRRCVAALFEVLATANLNTARNDHQIDQDLWQSYLSAFWLRPETALILYAEALAIRSLNLDPAATWLDLGCGDGIHAALYSGWRFDPGFDAFSCLDLTAADMYNRFDPTGFVARIERRGRSIDYGMDIKQTAVARATALNVFANTKQADATMLPLADGSIGVIFSNMLRDLGDPLPEALKECRRVLSANGTLLISTMTPDYARHLHFAPAAARAQAAGDHATAAELLKLDRGRSVFCQRQLTIEQWTDLLAAAGLRLHTARPIVGPSIIRFWDIGLRPFIHALLAQRQSWQNAGVLTTVKASMLAGLNYLLTPLVSSLTTGVPCMQLLEVHKV